MRKRPFLIVDACLHSGLTLLPVLDRLEEYGFSDVRLGVVHHAVEEANMYTPTPNLVLKDPASRGVCYPFGFDRLLEKTYASIFSRPSSRPIFLRTARALRQKINSRLDILGE